MLKDPSDLEMAAIAFYAHWVAKATSAYLEEEVQKVCKWRRRQWGSNLRMKFSCQRSCKCQPLPQFPLFSCG